MDDVWCVFSSETDVGPGDRWEVRSPVPEQVIAKLTALLGNDSGVGNFGIPFTHVDRLRSVCTKLHDAGYQRMGREAMFSGITGEKLDGLVFMGMVYYQRLRHMVHAGLGDNPPPPSKKKSTWCMKVSTSPGSKTSSTATVVLLSTRTAVSRSCLGSRESAGPHRQGASGAPPWGCQPTEGRARHGGLRIGEMERDCSG